MIRALGLVLAFALFAAPAGAAPARRSAAKASPGSSSPKSSTAATRHAAGKDSLGGGSRTLDEIHIEGEVAVPQVLFITARDQRRFMDFQNHRYLKSSKQLGASTVYPQWIQVNSPAATEARKEPSR